MGYFLDFLIDGCCRRAQGTVGDTVLGFRRKVVALGHFLHLDLRLGSETSPVFSFPSLIFNNLPNANPYICSVES